MDIGLIGFPLLFSTFIFAYILFRIIFQHRIFTSRELGYSITEHILFLFKHTIGHTVCHYLFTVNDDVGNGSFRFQTLVCGNIQTVLNSKTQDAYRLTHIFVQVTLSQDTPIALGIVHRTVGRIQMYQCMQALLNVHARTKRKGRTENHANLATVYLFKDFKFLFDGHSRPHYYNLISRNTLCNQFVSNVIVQVETALLVLVIVGKDGNRTFVVGCFFQ